MNQMLGLFAAVLLINGLFGCATRPEKSLATVRLGMDKADVLERAGNPKRTARKGSVDNWTYVYFINDLEHQQEIQFADNRVIAIHPVKVINGAEAEKEVQVLRDYERLVKEKENARKSK